MLILQGILKTALVIPQGLNKKTGEIFPARSVIQVETVDQRGLASLMTITVPDVSQWVEKVSQTVHVPVRAWAKGEPVNFMFEAS